jgi:thioesterase domain-containing protein
MASVIDMWVANLRMLWRYQPPPLAAPLTFVRAEAEETEAFQAWRSLAAGRFRELVAPGNHYTVVRRPHVGEVARIVSSSQDWAMEDES